MLDAFSEGSNAMTEYWLDPTDTAGVARFNHVPGGCNVLWMDGHVEFQKYGNNFPVGIRSEASLGGSNWNMGTVLPAMMTVAAGMG